MRIAEIHIEEFGGVSEKHITLDSGFNLLCGANESGKTTLCDFIKYIFYGFSGSDERTAKSNFRTGASSGYIIIEDDNGILYRISRRVSEKSRERLSVHNEVDGSEFNLWKNDAPSPGDYFLGVAEKLYTRSLYVSQESGARLDGGSAEAVSNLLISGDEAVNLKKAKNALDEYRKSLRHKKGRAGKICETEDRVDALKADFENGAKIKEELSELNFRIKSLEETKESCSAQLENTRRSLAGARAIKIKKLLSERSTLETRRAELLKQEKILTEQNTVNGFLPDEGYIRELTVTDNKASTHRKNHTDLKAKLSTETEKKRPLSPKGYMEYVALGGRDTVKEKYKKVSSAKRTLQLFAVFCGILSLASIISFFIPDSFGIQLERSIIFTAASTASALLFGFLCIRQSVKLHRLNKKLCISAKRPFLKAFSEFDIYEKGLGDGYSSLEGTVLDYEKSANETEAELKGLLSLWGKSSAKEATDAFSSFIGERNRIKQALDSAVNDLQICTARLSVYTDSEINEAETASFSLPSNAPESESEENRAELEEKIRMIELELNTLKINRAEKTGGGMPMLDRLSIEINEAETLLKRLNFSYDAAELAISALTVAENSIRHTVSPYLSETAGDYFSLLTKKRYSGLHLDSSMSLKYRDGETGEPIDSTYLSGGSADLAWICLRLALHKKLSENRRAPIILDECFVYFDDMRLKAILKKLTDMAERDGTQILLFSASTREKDILQKTVNTVKI